MNRVHRKYTKIEGYKVGIKINKAVDLQVSEGEDVKKGQILFNDENSEVVFAHNISAELEISPKESSTVMCRVDGEFVSAGEIIAEKVSRAGLSTSKVIAQASGILNLSKINYGIAEIVSEKKKRCFVAPFNGKLVRIDSQDSLQIETSAIRVNCFANKNELEEMPEVDELINYRMPKEVAPLVIIKERNSVITIADIDVSVSGKVVFAGRHLEREVANRLMSLGAVWIIANSMNYDDYKAVNGRISVLSGFGNMEINDRDWEFLKNNDGNMVVLDDLDENFVILDAWEKPKSKQQIDEGLILSKYIRHLEVGDAVVSCDPNKFGREGVIVEIEELESYCLVKFDGEEKSSVVATALLKSLL